nr:LysM domain-containing protein [Xanthomonas arboricola]
MNAYASTDVGTYKVTVQAGDTLRGLAQRLYGNSNLWYVLAEANAIDDDSGLVAGATLNVPDVKANTNDASTFKPFNASEAIGSTTPSLPYIPKPPESGCGTLGMIIMVVVAVVVTYFTAGATAGYFAGVFGAASSTVGAVAAAAATYTVAGAAGSIVSQGVGSAMGQTSFSWRNVAASAIASGATAGFSTAVSASVGPVVGAMSTAAVGNVSNYLANRLVGNEASFSWRSVAASAVTAGITQQLAPTIARSIGVDTMKYGQATVAGITGGVVSASLRRGSIDYTDLAVDAFSNVLVNSLTQSSSTSLFDPDTAIASADGGGAPGRYARDRNGNLTLDTVEVRATRSNTSSIQVRASDQQLRDQALMRAVGAQTVENIRADRRRSNAIDVGAFQRSNALDIGAINAAARIAPSTGQPVTPMPVNREVIPVEPGLSVADLPAMENLYAPRVGDWEQMYQGFMDGATDPGLGVVTRGLGYVGGAATAIPMMIDGMISGIYNAPNNAGIAGQKFAQAGFLTGHERNIAYIEGGLSFATAFLGVGDMVTMGQAGAIARSSRRGALGKVEPANLGAGSGVVGNEAGALGGLSDNQLAALRSAGLDDAEIALHIETLGDVQLFRGTTQGFPGNPVLQQLGITPASTDPLVATVFALEGKAIGGDAVILTGGMRRFGAGDIEVGNIRSSLEREVQVNMRPSQFEALAPNSIPVDTARKVLSDMGVANLPPTITGSHQATQILETTSRLTPAQIQEFLTRAGVGN